MTGIRFIWPIDSVAVDLVLSGDRNLAMPNLIGFFRQRNAGDLVHGSCSVEQAEFYSCRILGKEGKVDALPIRSRSKRGWAAGPNGVAIHGVLFFQPCERIRRVCFLVIMLGMTMPRKWHCGHGVRTFLCSRLRKRGEDPIDERGQLARVFIELARATTNSIQQKNYETDSSYPRRHLHRSGLQQQRQRIPSIQRRTI